LIERQIESAKLRPANFIVTKGWNSLPLFPNWHSLESPGVADISISYRSAECPERIGCCQGTFPTLASALPGYALESRQAASGPSWSYDECPLLGLAVPERIVAIPPIGDLQVGKDKWLLRVCAVERRRFPVGASPTRRPL